MRTLATQVKLRRLIRAFGEARSRLASEPLDRRVVASVVDRLNELAADVWTAWRHEAGAVDPVLAAYVAGSLRTAELATAGLGQAGADLDLLREDFEAAALPLEVFLRGLDMESIMEPVLQRSA